MISTDLQVKYQQNQFTEIIDIWESMQLNPKQDPQSAFILAATYFQLGNFDKCSELCSLIDGFFSNDVNFLSLFASCLRRQNLLSQSEKYFLQALEMDPESIQVQNNYSNLLIEQSNYNKARGILEKILQKDPSYQDAKDNYDRVISLINSQINIKSSKNKLSANSNEAFLFSDPIMDAFEVHEVVKCGGLEKDSFNSNEDLIGVISNQDFEEAEHELLKLAQSQISTQQYKSALKTISNLSDRKGLHGSFYQIATEAYIGLKNYQLAEIMALNAINLEYSNISLLINLANLSAMRKDFKVSKFWLDKASRLNGDDPILRKSINLLFPNGKPREKNNPFQ